MTMKKRKQYWLAVLVATALSFAVARAQQSSTQTNQPAGQSGSKSPAAGQMPQPKPGPEMEKLNFLLGNFSDKDHYEKTPLSPNGGEYTSSYTGRLGPGGFSQIADFHGDSPEGPFEGHEVITWDAQEKAYKSYTVGNNFAGAVMRTGHWEGKDLVFVGDFNSDQMKMTLKLVTTPMPTGEVVLTESFAMNGAPMQLFLTTTAKKQ
jgi:hypothetical protein